jgi:hypothetical protein
LRVVSGELFRLSRPTRMTWILIAARDHPAGSACQQPPATGVRTAEISLPCPVGHRLDISLEKRTLNLRSHTPPPYPPRAMFENRLR